MSRQDDRRSMRVAQCDQCKKKNILGVREEVGQPFKISCSNCGEYPGIISSYRLCPHDPIHRWNEQTTCEKAKCDERATKKRHKEVFSTDEIPHLWVHAWETQGSARNSGRSLFFEGATIYSYGHHFKIAMHVETKRGSAILFNTDSRSVTTSKHQSFVRQAIPNGTPVFNVARMNLDTYTGRETHKLNLVAYQTDIDSNLLKALRARSSWSKESKHERAMKLREERNAYVKFFGLHNKPLRPIPALDSKLLDGIKAKEKERVRVETEKTKIAKAERMARAIQTIADWRIGKGDSYGIPYEAPTMLRISADGQEVETSRGARIPVAHAIKALAIVRKVVERQEAFVTNGHTIPVGVYKIERIETDGTIKAGCHVITLPEIERIAPALDAVSLSHDGKPIPQEIMDDFGSQG